MEYYFLAYIITLLSATSLLYTFFNSSLPCLIAYIIKGIGYKKNNKDFWIVPSDEVLLGDAAEPRSPLTWTNTDFEEFALNKLPLFLSSLITCRYCLCYHIIFWINLFAFIALFIAGYNISLLFFLACVMSQPILAHILYNITDKLK